MYSLNNDVLSIISLYVGFPIRFNKHKLIINLDNNCESCNKRMRRTDKSLIEAYTFPKLWQIDKKFLNETGKYIRTENTFIFFNKIMYTYNEAKEKGIINYRYNISSQWGNRFETNHIYGAYLETYGNDIEIYVKKAPSLSILYKALKDQITFTNEKEFLTKLKCYHKNGIDPNILLRCKNQINIINNPEKIVIRLCYQCRKKVKKGYIFV